MPSAALPRFAGGERRQLYRLDLKEGPTGNGDPGAPNIAVVVDVETTGLDPKRDVIIELAMRQFRYDEEGLVTNIGRPFTWLQDPGRPLTPEIMRLTGLDDGMLRGQSIDANLASAILRRANLVVAHNAGFDRPRVEARLPDAAGLAWACSCLEIGWRDFGFDGKGLGYLLSQAGYYNGAHRAAADVDSTIALLAHEVAPGRSAMAELLARSSQATWMAWAEGAAYDCKDDLKARGYRWDPNRRVWCREVVDRDEEEAWLMMNVYSPAVRPTSAAPVFRQLSARERWA